MNKTAWEVAQKVQEDWAKWREAVSIKERQLLKDNQVVLETLPAPESANVDNKIRLFYSAEHELDSMVLTEQLRELLGAKTSQREVSKDTGTSRWITTAGAIIAYVSGAGLAFGCRIEPVQETVTRFKVICDDKELDD